MSSMAQLQELFNTEKITNIRLHINPSNLYLFHNTFFIQALSRTCKGIIDFTVVKHEHPQSPISQLPFVILNKTHVIAKPLLLDLFDALSFEQPAKLLAFRPVYKICEELSSVGVILSEDDFNPYWLMLSPYKKYEMNKWLNNHKKYIYDTTRYFRNLTDELNDNFLTQRIDTLAGYIGSKKTEHKMVEKIEGGQIECQMEQMKPQEASFYQSNQMIADWQITTLCVYAMIKSLYKNNSKLYEVIMQNQTFKLQEQQGLKIVTKVNSQLRPLMPHQPRYYSTLKSNPLKENQKPKEEEKTELLYTKLEFAEKLIPLALGLCIFWKVKDFISTGR